MGIVKEETTLHTFIKGNFLGRVDFTDTFSVTNHGDNLYEISNLIFNHPPKWISLLFSVRNKLVKLVGLKSEIPKDHHTQFSIGGYIGFFKIFSISDTQLVLGVDDTHLNFRAVILKTAELTHNVKVITLVQYHNSFGKFYMNVIKPFHRLVVKRMVKNAYRESINS